MLSSSLDVQFRPVITSMLENVVFEKDECLFARLFARLKQAFQIDRLYFNSHPYEYTSFSYQCGAARMHHCPFVQSTGYELLCWWW